MAIQLARAIGLQGGIPQSNLPQMIKEGGDAIVGALKEERAAKQAKALKDQALKDAIAANIKIDTGEATPEDNAERENYIKTTVPELAISQQTDSPSVYQKKVDDFIFGLKERNRIYKNNWDAIAKATELSKTHHMEDFENYLYKGTPSVEKTFGVDTEAIDKQIAEYEADRQKDLSSATDEKQKEDINESYDSVINKLKEQKNQPQQKEIIQGEEAYFKLPFEEKKKIDLNKKLEEKVLPIMPNALDVAKGLFTPTFSAGDYVTRTTTAKQGYQFSKDEKAIERDAEAFGDYIANPPLAPTKEYVPMHRNLLKQVMDDLSGKYTQKYLEEHPEEIKETVKKLAKKKFMDEANREADAQMIRKKQEIEKGKGGGITIGFGGAETKKDNYNLQIYNAENVAKSNWNNVTKKQEIKKYTEKYKVKLENELAEIQIADINSPEAKEYIENQYNELNKKYVEDGRTKEQTWIDYERKKLARFEGKKSLTFNNKKEESVSLSDGNKTRRYIPSRVIFDNDGTILGIEATIAIEKEKGEGYTKGESVEILPPTTNNIQNIENDFPELFKVSKEVTGVELKKSEAPKSQATKSAATKPAAQKTWAERQAEKNKNK